MSTPERCLAQAEEAERLAALVSYARDRQRLQRQAAEWRARAQHLRDSPDAGACPSPRRSPLRRWLDALTGARRSRGAR